MYGTYTLLYDGNCRICTSQIRTVAAYDDNAQIELLDMNSPEAQARFPQVTPEMAQRELHLVAPDGSLYRGAEAIRETLLRLPSLRGLGELLRLPGAMGVARPIYAWIAENRYILGGRVERCDDGSCSPGKQP
jgi:predicted DCC family thiol-disulfide oxidoreductase YuxK